MARYLMVGTYGRLLRSPGVPRLATSFLALGIAGTMAPVAFVLFARAATGSFATASFVLAASTAGGLLFAPARGRLVDRFGPRDAVLYLAVPDIASRQAGFAVMTMMQETNFIAGPLIAGAVIAVGSPTAAVATTALLSFVGAVMFATTQKATRRGPKPTPTGRLPALAGAGIRTVVATSAAFGLTFGILDVAFPAFARTHGSAATAGVLLSAFAAGSWVGGFIYGLRPRERSAGQQYPGLCLLAGLGLAPLILTPGLPVMAAFAGLSGLCFAPITTWRAGSPRRCVRRDAPRLAHHEPPRLQPSARIGHTRGRSGHRGRAGLRCAS